MTDYPNAPSSHGVLPDSLQGCHVLICELVQGLQQALSRIAVLEEQAKLNSRNASKPPSSDGPGSRGDRPSKPLRSQSAAKEVLGTSPTGVLVTDRYVGYRWGDDAQRQVCWVCLLRDFRRIGQRDGLAGSVGRALRVMGQWMLHRGTLAPARPPWVVLPWLMARMHRTMMRGAQQSFCAKTAQTCRNLLELWPGLWRFTTDPAIAPTNHLAERALRGVVIHRKISYVTRSGRGMRFVERAYHAAHIPAASRAIPCSTSSTPPTTTTSSALCPALR